MNHLGQQKPFRMEAGYFVIYGFILCLIFFFFFFFYFLNLFIYFFGCVGSSFLCEGFLQLWQAGATLHRGARASHCRGLSCCGAQAPDAPALIVAHGPSCSAACGNLPRPGLEPVSPALAGRFSTTAPPGKPHASFSYFPFSLQQNFVSHLSH